MTKSELIDTISSVNRSATREFLSEFTERDLADYMRQLEDLGALRSDGVRTAGTGPESRQTTTA